MPWEKNKWGGTDWVFAASGRRWEMLDAGVAKTPLALDEDLNVWSGDDKVLAVASRDSLLFDDDDALLTPEERAELADEMIARWQRFKLGDAGKNAVIDNGILWGSCPVAVDIGTDVAGRVISAHQGQPLGKGLGHHWGSPCESCGAVKFT